MTFLFNNSWLNIEQNISWCVYLLNLTLEDMKTISNNKNRFPKPFRFTIYLFIVIIVGFMNWAFTYADDTGMGEIPNLESRLTKALVSIPDPEPELEDWLLSFSHDLNEESNKSKTSLEVRLAEAQKPVADPEPELEDWLLNLSDDILTVYCE
jgi:hypothetical protein